VFYLAAVRSHPAFRAGIKDMLPAAPGIAAWGLMTGVAMTKSGLSLIESLCMTFVVFAGSAQLASLPLIAVGAPLWVILATAFCVNLRFVVFSAHLRQFVMHLPRQHRMPLGFMVGDITYVLFTQRHAQPAPDETGQREQVAFLAGHAICNMSAWMGSSVIGCLLASFIPTQWGIGFAGVLALLGISFSLAADRMRLIAAAVASVAAIMAFALPLRLNVLVAIAAAVVVCLAVERQVHAAMAKRI
jgi:predicted branched-subunit amino acid permease